MTSNRFAAIIDGDNLTQGGHLGLATVHHVFEEIAGRADGCPVAFAMQRKQALRYMSAYVDQGWGIRFASMAPDAADHLLLEEAAFFLDHGVTDLWVASGDHAFSALAGHVRLHVLAYSRNLSRQLRRAATSVHYLDGALLPAA